ncbi:hypothetical protein [Neptuniibacter pectenicola]|uniref:hypothetical protein n=1 Tax=Neptuniibacter pectenicola TaxID=1806669 RepID=UPI000799E28A|nr:hypothetical protein [Neptuniibacter pectenicola]KXJ57190.1 MAG: hypothetical protein AXW15_13725 [Neptuniibacter sp. Phe_28]
MTRKTLTRNQILKAKDSVEEWVPTPEWGEGTEVLVKTWSASERDEFDRRLADMQSGGKLEPRALIVALSVVDAKTKQPIFEPSDIATLAKKNCKTMDRIFQVSMRLNPISEEETEAIVEEKAKNS